MAETMSNAIMRDILAQNNAQTTALARIAAAQERQASALERLAGCITTRTRRNYKSDEYSVTSLRIDISPFKNQDYDN